MATHGRVEVDLAEVRQLADGPVYARPFEYPLGLIFQRDGAGRSGEGEPRVDTAGHVEQAEPRLGRGLQANQAEYGVPEADRKVRDRLARNLATIHRGIAVLAEATVASADTDCNVPIWVTSEFPRYRSRRGVPAALALGGGRDIRDIPLT